MLDLTYTEIFIKSIKYYFYNLSIKKLIKLLVHSIIFRCIIILVALAYPQYIGIIISFIYLYSLLIKPLIYSKGVLKVFFFSFIYTALIILTIFLI